MSRFTGFKFNAPRDFNGKPMYTLPTVPARDLESDDVRLLSKEQYEDVKAAKLPNGNSLYEPIRAGNGKDEPDEEPVEDAPVEDESAADEEADDAAFVDDDGEAFSSVE